MSIKRSLLKTAPQDGQFNMTAMIDIVFLLIIFFMLVCQFITSENYQLVLPDDCPAAVVPDNPDTNAVTVSVFKNAQDELFYAVRAKLYDPQTQPYRDNPDLLMTDLAGEITRQTSRKKQPLVHLRADQNMSYSQVQNALLALAQSGVTRIQLAAYRSDQNK